MEEGYTFWQLQRTGNAYGPINCIKSRRYVLYENLEELLLRCPRATVVDK